MNRLCANLIYPVLENGLNLRDRLADGGIPNLQVEQASFTALLNHPNGARLPDFGRNDKGFLGIRYALSCWLDELFIDDTTAFGRGWDNQKLEQALFGTNLRYSQFWTQANLARGSESGSDALEVYLICAMLGFRGQFADRPDDLREWVDEVRSHIKEALGKKGWGKPHELARRVETQKLIGRESFQKMIMAWVITLSILVVVSLLIWLLYGA